MWQWSEHLKLGKSSAFVKPDLRRLPLTEAEFEADFFLDPEFSTKRQERWMGRLIIVKSTLPDANRQTGRPMSACMTYELEDLGRTTKVTEDIDISGATLFSDLSYVPMQAWLWRGD